MNRLDSTMKITLYEIKQEDTANAHHYHTSKYKQCRYNSIIKMYWQYSLAGCCCFVQYTYIRIKTILFYDASYELSMMNKKIVGVHNISNKSYC